MSKQSNEHRFLFFSPDSSDDETPQSERTESPILSPELFELAMDFSTRMGTAYYLACLEQRIRDDNPPLKNHSDKEIVSQQHRLANIGTVTVASDKPSAEEKNSEEYDESDPMNQPD